MLSPPQPVHGEALSPEELERRLRAVGQERYHIHHPFHKTMNAGGLSKPQLQAWALNRYCYQAIIPKKDAIILSKSDDPAFRREWRKRIVDHDGEEGAGGGMARWFHLASCLGLDADVVASKRLALPATRFAVNAYADLVASEPLMIGAASSLTELFSPVAIGERVPAMLERYDYITEDALAYFKPRLHQAPRDADFALALVKEWATNTERQTAVVNALLTKCDILWAQLDALYHAYVAPGHIPPGAFVPEVES